MKVKIGNMIFDSTKQPIMMILSDQDKSNICQMLPECRKYCSYPDDVDPKVIEAFMTPPD